MGWIYLGAWGNLSYISLTFQYDGDLPGLYPYFNWKAAE